MYTAEQDINQLAIGIHHPEITGFYTIKRLQEAQRREKVIYSGDALTVLRQLNSESVQCCVTSPPYFQLRDYGVDGQIGLEDTPEEFIAKLVEVFHEVKRVLKPDGTLWVNIADSYAGSGKGRNTDGRHSDAGGKNSKQSTNTGAVMGRLKKTVTSEDAKPKDLLGIPWMLAFALRADGWYLRSDILWKKTNPIPESVKDRPTRCHEYIFLLSKSRTYYYDYEAVMEDAVGYNNAEVAGSEGTLRLNTRRRKGNAKSFRGGGAYTNNRSFDNSAEVERETHGNVENKTGKRNLRDVWSVATQGTKEAHFATFPEKLIEPCILAGTKAGDVVLDPFAGSGTTGIVAHRYGREFIGIELNEEYAELARRRISDVQMRLVL